MTFDDLIKANESAEKPQSGKEVINKIDKTVAVLLDAVEHNVIENKKICTNAVDAIVKLANIRPKFMIEDTKEIKQQVVRELVKESMKIAEKKGIFDELG